jgi:CubicO group peptidase (beta-lactamase class C family)
MNTATTLSPFALAVDAAIDQALSDRRIVGTVVLVSHRGEPVYARAAGWADREARRPMREDAIFLLASVTKPIVTVAALRLAEQGRLGLHDPVTRWLPDFRPRLADGREPAITVHQLLTHSAGLSYDFMEPPGGPYQRLRVSSGLDQPGLAFDENLRRIAAAPLHYAPGEAWGYSTAIDVLGALVERASDAPLPETVRRQVTEPLGMVDTDFAVRDRARLPAFYGDGQPAPLRMGEQAVVRYFDAEVKFAPGRIFDAASFPSGGAGMAGTAHDVMALLETLRRGGGALLRPHTVDTMFQPHVGAEAQTRGPGWGFGYGGAVLVDPLAAGSPQSAGTLQWGGAYGHHWFIDRARGLSVVALTNTSFEGMAGRYTVDVRDAVYAALRAE